MDQSGRDIVVTSPDHQWLGTQADKDEYPTVIGVLIGKSHEAELGGNNPSEDIETQLKRESRELDITALFFQKKAGSWELVPVERLGKEPYVIHPALAANFFYNIDACADNAAQAAYLRAAGMAINGQFVGV